MQTCRPAKCIEAIRVALLDSCTLLPVCGPLNGYAMGCIIEPNWTPEIEEGEESVTKDNCGNICLRDDRCDLTKRWNLEFKIKDPDKEFLALITGNPLIVEEGTSIGVRHLSYGSCTPYVFLEMFERTGDCQVDGDPIYIRHIFPAVRLQYTGNEREGIFRILQIEGKTRDVLTDSVGTGPYGDIPAAAIVGTTATERIDYAWFEDDFLPTLQCGAIEIPCPPEPTVVSAVSPECENFTITGTNFDLVNHILVGTALVDYYDPAGPDAGLNPGTATINSWTPTLIDITDTQLAGLTISDVQMWGVADTPDYGVFEFADFVVADCPPPGETPGFQVIDEGSSPVIVAQAHDIAVDSTGRYLVAARVDDGGTDQTIGVYRFLEGGTLDATWGTGGLITQNLGAVGNDSGVGVAVDLSNDSVYVSAVRDSTSTVVVKYDSAGTLVAGFGTAGVLVVSAVDAQTVPKGMYVESTGNIVVAWNDGIFPPIGKLSRYTSTGAVVDSVAFSHAIHGTARNGGDGLYAALLLDVLGAPDPYVATAVLGGAINEALIAGDLTFANVASPEVTAGVASDGTSIYIASANVADTVGVVGKFDALTLAADATFDTDGLQQVSGVGASQTQLYDVVILAGGDIIVSGDTRIDPTTDPLTARLTSSGAFVGTYGVAGILDYPSIGNAGENARFFSTILEEADARTVHVGMSNDAGVTKVLIARTLISDGSLDPSFSG